MASPTTKPTAADEILAALSVGVRRDILRLIDADGPLSPKVLAGALGLPLPNTSYHVKVLCDTGLIELVSTAPRRGALEHFYKRSRKNASRVDEIMASADRLRR